MRTPATTAAATGHRARRDAVAGARRNEGASSFVSKGTEHAAQDRSSGRTGDRHDGQTPAASRPHPRQNRASGRNALPHVAHSGGRACTWDVTARILPAMTSTPAPKRVADSHIVLVQAMELTDANLAGNVHGGVIMKLVDTAAGLAASRHCAGRVVTAAMDEMSFIEPVMLGDLVTLRASVNDVGSTSMEVGVRVEAEHFRTGRKVHASSAYLVFVALDEQGRPRAVPPIVAETEDERRRQRAAKIRRAARLQRKEQIRSDRDELLS